MLVALFHGFTSFLLESIFPCGLKGFPRLHFHWLRQLLQVSQTIETKGIFRAHWVTWHNNNIILKSGGFMNSTYSNLSHDNLHLTDVDFGNYIYTWNSIGANDPAVFIGISRPCFGGFFFSPKNRNRISTGSRCFLDIEVNFDPKRGHESSSKHLFSGFFLLLLSV